MLFRDIIGNSDIKKQLINSVNKERISHAQLFVGAEGSGALPLAIAYAQYICCTNKQTDDSCGTCESCLKYNRYVHPDLYFSYPFIVNKASKVELSSDVLNDWVSAIKENPYLSLNNWVAKLNAENKQPNIPIAECHSIIKRLSLKPIESEYKVLIMWLPEYLGTEGNSLLKIIEEPPHKTLFLLVAENRERIINTILSRTQLIKINKLKMTEIESYLIQKYNLEASVANRIAYLSEGNLSIAYSLLNNDESGNELSFAEWMRLCYTSNGVGLVKWTDEVSKKGREKQKNFLKYGINLLRDCMLNSYNLNELIFLEGEDLVFISKFSKIINDQNLPLIVKEIEYSIYHIERNANPKILFLDLSLQINKLLKMATN